MTLYPPSTSWTTLVILQSKMARWPKDSPGTWYSRYKRGSMVSRKAQDGMQERGLWFWGSFSEVLRFWRSEVTQFMSSEVPTIVWYWSSYVLWSQSSEGPKFLGYKVPWFRGSISWKPVDLHGSSSARWSSWGHVCTWYCLSFSILWQQQCSQAYGKSEWWGQKWHKKLLLNLKIRKHS